MPKGWVTGRTMMRLEGRYEDRFFPRVSPLDAKELSWSKGIV